MGANHRWNHSFCLHQHHSYQDMNNRCASTLFVVAMSVIAVVYGAPADATVGASNGVMCECTFTKEQAQGNTFVDCPAPNKLQTLTICRLFTKKGHPYNLMGTKNYYKIL